jgi:hypothetical protein
MIDKNTSEFYSDDLVISMLGIALFILMLFVMVLVPNNNLGIDHLVFGVIAGACGLIILIKHVRKSSANNLRYR